MKIATWNLEDVRPGVGPRSTRIREAMERVAPDVWVLTESHPEFVPDRSYIRAAISAPAPDRLRRGCWVAIWVREGVKASALRVTQEPERAAGVLVCRSATQRLLIFGTVLPWRGDKRHDGYRGRRAFLRSLAAQASDWDSARMEHPGAELCVAGDFNQELDSGGPVGTPAGRDAFRQALAARSLTCVTGGTRDPLRARGWRSSIDHILLSDGLRVVEEAPAVWPEEYPLPRGWPDHHGVAVTVTGA